MHDVDYDHMAFNSANFYMFRAVPPKKVLQMRNSAVSLHMLYLMSQTYRLPAISALSFNELILHAMLILEGQK